MVLTFSWLLALVVRLNSFPLNYLIIGLKNHYIPTPCSSPTHNPTPTAARRSLFLHCSSPSRRAFLASFCRVSDRFTPPRESNSFVRMETLLCGAANRQNQVAAVRIQVNPSQKVQFFFCRHCSKWVLKVMQTPVNPNQKVLILKRYYSL